MNNKIFHNADNEIIPYDGSELTWRVSVYALVIQNHKLLIIKNRLEKLYDVVGGGIEFGETIEEALHREAREEAGATIKIGELLKVHEDFFYHHRGTFHQTLQLFYTAEIIGDIVKSTDPDIEWKGFVPLKKIGKEYRLPTVVEQVVKEKGLIV